MRRRDDVARRVQNDLETIEVPGHPRLGLVCRTVLLQERLQRPVAAAKQFPPPLLFLEIGLRPILKSCTLFDVRASVGTHDHSWVISDGAWWLRIDF